MNLLPLDDPRWRDLCHRNWSAGKPSAWVPDAPFVPDVLAKLVQRPDDIPLFTDLWPWLCSEETAWAASYAVVPYAVDLARRVKPADRMEYLFFVGLVVIYSCPDSGEAFEIPSFVQADYQAALKLALPLAGETLTADHDQTDTRYLLSTIAALKGHMKLAEVLNHIDCVSGECEKCGVSVFPAELQEIV